MSITKFRELSLSDGLRRALAKHGYLNMTTVQSEAIPPLREWKDVIAKAPTGTGKTIAFALPMIEHIDVSDRHVQGLILAPTRELALQISGEIRKLCAYTPDVRVATIYGGQKMDIQLRALKQCPQILVATPGRLRDHMGRGTIDIGNVLTVVLDEADRMVDMGFVKEVTQILDMTAARRNLALMSATLSREVMDISWIYQRQPVEIEVANIEEDRPPIMQYSVELRTNKTDDMIRIIEAENYQRVIVFCNTKHLVRRLTATLVKHGMQADCIHGDIRQNMRERVMDTFKKGRLRVLVATDVAARGIDVTGVDAVFNYDIPEENEYYLHRIGRTGRAKQNGVSYIFCGPFEKSRLRDLMRFSKEPMIEMRFDENFKLVPVKSKK